MHHKLTDRFEKERSHSRMLSKLDPELVWGWGKPAGKLRAKRRANLVIEGAKLDPSKFVLEIGCGSGMFTEIFASSGAHITAIDLSADLLEMAKARGVSDNQVTFMNTSLEGFKSNNLFDAVIGSSVLHHLDLNIALERIFHLLKPGGILSFAEPNLLNPQVFIERKFNKVFPWLYYVSDYEVAFVRCSFKKCLETFGFRQVSIKPFDWLHPSTPPAAIPFINWLGGKFEKIPLLKEFSGSLFISAKRPEP